MLTVRDAPPLHRGETTAPFFIVGAGRSGTTLLRRMLVAHPRVHVPPETYVLPRIIPAFRWVRHLPWRETVREILGEFEAHPEFRHFGIDLGPLAARVAVMPPQQRSLAAVLDALYRYHAAATGKPQIDLWGDKTPLNTFHLPLIDRVFPRARYVHLVRDPVDVVDSAVRARLARDAAAAATRWRDAVRAARSFAGLHPGRVLEVRYEDLVADSDTELRTVCAFLTIDFRPEMVHDVAVAETMGDARSLPHHRAVREPVTRSSVGRGRRELSVEETTIVERLAGDELLDLGYGGR